MSEDLNQRLSFVVLIDKMKSIQRRALLLDRSRHETDAEHSWHLALMAMLFQDYADKNADVDRVIKMVLVHDLVEIYAGDTFAYDEKGMETKRQRELESADRIFGGLPEALGRDMRFLWEEFEAGETPDARFANALDRLQPLITNLETGGLAWRQGNVTDAKVIARMKPIEEALPALWPFVLESVADATQKGWLISDPHKS